MKYRIKRIIAVMLMVVMLVNLVGCYTPGQFYHEVLLGEKRSDSSSSSRKKKDRKTEEATEEETEETTEEIEYADGENEEFQQFLWDYFEDCVTASTMNYNDYIMDESAYDIEMGEATLGDASLDAEALEKEQEKDEDFYDRLLEFEGASMNEDEAFTYECLKTDTEISMHFYDNVYFYEPFSPMSGVQENILTSFLEYRFDDKGDVEDYLTMLGQVRDYFGELIEFEYTKSDEGYFMSDSVADEVIDQCDEVINQKGDHFLVTIFNDNIEALDYLSEEEIEDFEARNKETVEDVLVPAYQDLKDTLEELKGTGTNDLGICGYEGGQEYYEDYIFPRYSGSDKTVDEEIEYMEERYENLLTEMTSIYYSNPEAYEDYVDKYGELYKVYEDMEAEEIIDLLQSDYMDDYPLEGTIPYEVSYMNDSMSKISENTLAYYLTNPIDNPDYNKIRVNGANTSGIFNTLAHEGCPGHMFQFWYFRNTDPNPGRVLESNSGYVEGWAVYTSYDAVEHCDFEGTEDNAAILAKLDKINTDLGYLVQARIDIGVNYEGWDQDDVEEYLETAGFDTSYASDMITTSAGDPGVYLSYSVGYYEMDEMRNYAEEKLGDRFDAKEYHKVVLDAGPCQFGMLKKKVDKYISENK